MAKSKAKDIKIEVEDAVMSLQDLTPYVDTLDGFRDEATTQETTPLGVVRATHEDTGHLRTEPITLEGFYDNTTPNGPEDLLKARLGQTVNFVITYVGTSTSSFAAVIQTYQRNPVRNEITRYVCTIQPTGDVTEAP